ncbi:MULTISPECIES: hypothetical protein [Prauserella salsuginis group]|uniref:Uncharacterized protein n=2 Tax=Prauserella salsuginis group TaxID=2893672 RepID=A0A839XT48_9PSEU|nr:MULTISPECIES: hypothetical protein [Prauserella salsuginis group]MBB3666380.1 hypothetical protein [Prauserella sediminis]MCR3719169.1 hypothetical protein [Prauserella flava]MCR3735818.1 hypothetical protein [Prauserella salsuginis]
MTPREQTAMIRRALADAGYRVASLHLPDGTPVPRSVTVGSRSLDAHVLSEITVDEGGAAALNVLRRLVDDYLGACAVVSTQTSAPRHIRVLLPADAGGVDQ